MVENEVWLQAESNSTDAIEAQSLKFIIVSSALDQQVALYQRSTYSVAGLNHV